MAADDQELDTLPTTNDRRRSALSVPSLPSYFYFVLSTSIASFVVILALKLNALTQPASDWNVDESTCTCNCWDRKFKGGYNPGGYKHVYFQMTTGASLLWLWSAAHFLLLFKFVELASACTLGSVFGGPHSPKVRWPVLFLSCLNFYGMFYNWWITFNYINDAGPHQDYHILLPTQLFFDVTDVIPGLALYSLLQDRKTLPSSRLLLASLIVSATHLVLSIWDQGFIHLLAMKGAVIRDAMFIVSDLAGLFGVGWYLHGGIRKSGRALGIGTGILLVCYLALKRIAGYR